MALTYPDLPTGLPTDQASSRSGTVFVPLSALGDRWRGGTPTPTAPDGPSLRCQDNGGRLYCGIESWFLPEAEASAVGRAVAGGTAVAVVRIDRRGNAALVEIRPGTQLRP